MKKNYILTACMLVFLLALTACSGGSDKKEEPSSGKMYDTGIELCAALSEISKDENYGHAMLSVAEEAVLEMLDNIRAMDYSQPEHVYRVKNMDEVISAGIYMAEFDSSTSSDIVKSDVEAKFVNGISSWITAQRTSTSALVVKSVFIINTSFVDSSVKDYEVYVYTFKEAYPVMVCYIPGKDGAVAATAGYIIVDDYIGADGDALSEDIGFAMLNIKLEEVENK